MVTHRPIGVYIHFPWCRNLCPYCDFAVTVVGKRPIPHQAYLDAVLTELAEQAPTLPGRHLVSIYFGGGTPSLWAPDCMAKAIAAVRDAFAAPLKPLAPLEITVEANPRDCDPDTMAAWRAARVTRLSIGVQSLAPRTLAVLGRDHRVGDGAAALHAALDAGFASVSADIIFGVPGAISATTPAASAAADIDAIAQRGPPHISAYELTIERRTHFGKATRSGALTPLDDDALADAYVAVHEALGARGYEHYEISSYARPGHRAIHNQLYWTGAEYLGLGCGAASFALAPADDPAGGRRWTNHRTAARYMRACGDDRVASAETLSPAEIATDRIWLGLRTRDGVDAADLDDRPALRDWLLQSGLTTQRGERFCPTLKGFLYADRIAARVAAG